jgi:predicted tellurium resistance membrane protein TerC
VFSRVTVGFGAAVIAVSGLATAAGATTTGTATIPAILGGLFILLAWLGRRITVQRPVRQWSPWRYPTIVAAMLVFSSAHGITLIFDALRTGTPPSASGIFQFGMVVAGIGYIIFGAWSEITDERRVARARATAPPARRSGRSRR